MPANTDRLVPRAPPLAGPGQSPGLTSLPGFPGPETDMRSIVFGMLLRASSLGGVERCRLVAARGETTMAGRSAIAYSRLLIVFKALWVLPAIQPASAQVSLPLNFISADVPHDVPSGRSASIQDLAIFAWREFIALNWVAMDPATTGTRGRPNVNIDFLSIKADKNGNFPLLVWQTYRHKNELFPAGGPADPNFDSSAPTYKYKYPATAGPNATLNVFNNLDETSEIGLCLMFAHYATNKIRIAYEAKVNRTEFDYANKNYLTKPDSGYLTLTNALANTRNNLAKFGGICGTDPTDPPTVSLPCAMPPSPVTPEKVPSKSKQLGAN